MVLHRGFARRTPKLDVGAGPRAFEVAMQGPCTCPLLLMMVSSPSFLLGPGMERRDWMALCAVHSDAWLMSVLFFYAARFDDSGRCGSAGASRPGCWGGGLGAGG